MRRIAREPAVIYRSSKALPEREDRLSGGGRGQVLFEHLSDPRAYCRVRDLVNRHIAESGYHLHAHRRSSRDQAVISISCGFCHLDRTGDDDVVRQISKLRFDAFASYARHPAAAAPAMEIAWFEWPESGLIATLQVDSDREFSGISLAPDLRERYRWVGMTEFHSEPSRAVVQLARVGTTLAGSIDEIRHQGDESGEAVDFFASVVPSEKLHPDYKRLATHAGYAPARALIELMMRWHEDADGNFVEQFQTTGFEARV